MASIKLNSLSAKQARIILSHYRINLQGVNLTLKQFFSHKGTVTPNYSKHFN